MIVIKKRYLIKIIIVVFIGLLFCGNQSCESNMDSIEDTMTGKNAEIIGSSHVRPTYYFGNEDCLNQGADVLLEMGTKVIKIWYYNGRETPDLMYPWNSNWQTGVTSLVEGLNNTYYSELFEKPFKTFVLNVASFVTPDAYYWRIYLSQNQIDQEEAEFYEFTKALLNKYEGTGKTFVLQHHEGDWHLRGHTNTDIAPTPEAIDRMTRWLNARQRGVTRARKEVNADNVFVYHAAEVNIILNSMVDNQQNMVNAVLPNTNLDLVSYSAYGTSLKAINGDRQLFGTALRYIKENMPDSEAFGDDNVYIGEFGIPSNYYTPLQVQAVIENTVETALEENCPYIIYWQLYDNEIKNPEAILPLTSNDDAKGYWLIKPDGTRSWHYDYLKEMIYN